MARGTGGGGFTMGWQPHGNRRSIGREDGSGGYLLQRRIALFSTEEAGKATVATKVIEMIPLRGETPVRAFNSSILSDKSRLKNLLLLMTYLDTSPRAYLPASFPCPCERVRRCSRPQQKAAK